MCAGRSHHFIGDLHLNLSKKERLDLRGCGLRTVVHLCLPPFWISVMLVSSSEMWPGNTIPSTNIYLTLRGLWLVLRVNKYKCCTNTHRDELQTLVCTLQPASSTAVFVGFWRQMSGTNFRFCHLLVVQPWASSLFSSLSHVSPLWNENNIFSTMCSKDLRANVFKVLYAWP